MSEETMIQEECCEEKCYGCQHGIEKMAEKEAESMRKHGWYSHMVYEDPGMPFETNCHTHGISTTWEHLDFQVVLPLKPTTVHSIFWRLIEKIKEGVCFQDGDTVDGVIGGNMAVLFIEKEEGDKEDKRPVLRVIIPDSNGCLGPSEMEDPFALQYK